MPLEVYAMIFNACLHFGHHAKGCSVACKYFLCFLLLLVEGCMQHTPNLYLWNHQNCCRHITPTV